ncbi:MAG: MFS transporter [Candidatus Bathyarchaeota archaeon]|nr:MFS transporter [Candidatus Bathyarchaeota archaeon]
MLRRLDRRFKVLLCSIGLQTWSSGLSTQYNQLYAVALGANPIELGSLESVGGGVSSAFSAPVGYFIDRFGVKKMLLLGLIFSVLVSLLYGCAINWWVLIPAIILMRISMMLIMPLTDIIIVGVTSFEKRALAMSFSRAVWAIPALFAPYFSATIISIFGGINVEGIRPIYFVQLAASLIATILVLVMLEPLPIQKTFSHQTSLKLGLIKGYRDLLKSEKWLKYWLVAWAVMRLGSMSAPFIPLWIVQVKGADQQFLGLMGTLSVLAQILLQIPVGSLADSIGRKKVFLILRPILYAGTLILIWAPNHEVLALAGILGAVGLMGPGGLSGIGGISFIPLVTMYWENFPAEKRGMVQGISGILDFIGSIASLLGGILWSMGYREIVIILPLLADLLILVPVFMRIPEGGSKH